MSLSPIALEALRAAKTAFSVIEADLFEDALARGLEAVDGEGRLVGAHSAEELRRLRDRVAELERQVKQAKAAGDLLSAVLVDRALEQLSVQPAPLEDPHNGPLAHRYATAHDFPDRRCSDPAPHAAHVAEAGLSSEWLCHGVPRAVEAGGTQ
ncbi:hypothetical protein ACWDG1_09485 [Streptomyces sp. NPDC001177]